MRGIAADEELLARLPPMMAASVRRTLDGYSRWGGKPAGIVGAAGAALVAGSLFITNVVSPSVLSLVAAAGVTLVVGIISAVHGRVAARWRAEEMLDAVRSALERGEIADRGPMNCG